MIKKMIGPLFKRFWGLFIAMSFVGMLALGLLMAFTNSYVNLNQTYPRYFNEYAAPSVTIDTNFHNVGDELEYIRKVNGVKKAEPRMTLDCYLKREDGRQITTRIFTYRENSEVAKLYERSSLSQLELSNLLPFIKGNFTLEDLLSVETPLWVAIDETYANNNNIKLGDTIRLGAFGLYIPVKVGKIVLSPETIYVRVKDYIWSDNKDFGFVYITPDQAKIYVLALDMLIDNAVKNNPDLKDVIENALEVAKIFFPNYEELLTWGTVDNFIENYGNQIMVVSDDKDNQRTADIIKSYLDGRGVKVKDIHIMETTTSYVYISNAARQIRIAAIFLPVFFYGITLFVIVLFINQMVKSMTSDIGIMMSIGIRGKEISAVFSIFILLSSLLSSALGLGFATLLMHLLESVFISTYHIPYILGGINAWLLLGGMLSLIIIGQGAVLIASKAIYRITPKDAMISNESKRKQLPKWLDRFIDKLSPTLRIGVNSIAQNLRRFLVSVFSIFAALTMIVITMGFIDSKNELLDQTLNRRLSYGCQVYMNETMSEEDIAELKKQEFVTSLAKGYFTYLEISNGSKSLMLQTVALGDDTPVDLIYIPDKSGRKDIEVTGDGIILDLASSQTLGVKVGDYVTINEKRVKVDNISYQYFNPTQYLKMSTLEGLTNQYASTLYADITDENLFLDYLSERGTNSLTVFSSSLREDLGGRFSSINIFAYILVAFSLAMALIILSIMTQNALLEQKRPLSVLRAVGFKTTNISNMWMVQSFLQLLISNLLAMPLGLLFCKFLFSTASSSSQIYPFVVKPLTLLICFAFILVVIIFAHMFAMISISRWNLADNTRSRE